MRPIATVSAVALSVLLVSGCATQEVARTYVTTETIDGRETTLYHAISQEYRFDSKGLFSNQEYLGLQTLLYEVCTRTTWYQGMDGIRSRLQVAAFLADEHGKAGKRLWVIQHDGHEFWHSHAHDPYVYILERACCDGLDRLTTYNASTGEFIESRDMQRNEKAQK
jgi:hypothetical protein